MNAFWKDKKVLLTGHTGFKGSWLSLWLQKLGATLTGFSKDVPTKPSLFELANVGKGMTSIMGDIRNFELISNVVREFKPEIIIHMAAQSLVHKSYKDPLETYSTNVMGTANLFESVRTLGKSRVIINVTSDKCYENNNEKNQRHQENDPMGGYDPYSNSKGCAELVTSSFRNSFFNPKEYHKHKIVLASARAGNVIGGGDWSSDRLIPDIMKGIIEHQTIKIRNPNSVRPWQFVLEPLNGYLLLAEKLWQNGPEYAEAWNFGPDENDTKTVSWILENISQQYDKMKWQIDDTKHPHETTYLRLDCSKAKKRLGWTPKTNLGQALKFTVEWYKQYEQKGDLRKSTEEQINHFNSL